MPHETDTTGDELRQEREDAKLTQAELAALMRTTQQYVSTIEGRAKVKPATAVRYRTAVYVYTSRPEAVA